MAQKMWCYICDMCSIVSYQPLKIKGKKKELHFCQESCLGKYLDRKNKNAKKS